MIAPEERFTFVYYKWSDGDRPKLDLKNPSKTIIILGSISQNQDLILLPCGINHKASGEIESIAYVAHDSMKEERLFFIYYVESKELIDQ